MIRTRVYWLDKWGPLPPYQTRDISGEWKTIFNTWYASTFLFLLVLIPLDGTSFWRMLSNHGKKKCSIPYMQPTLLTLSIHSIFLFFHVSNFSIFLIFYSVTYKSKKNSDGKHLSMKRMIKILMKIPLFKPVRRVHLEIFSIMYSTSNLGETKTDLFCLLVRF